MWWPRVTSLKYDELAPKWAAISELELVRPGYTPADTLCNKDVIIKSKRRHFDAITSKWRRFDVITTLLSRHVFSGTIPYLSWRNDNVSNLYLAIVSAYLIFLTFSSSVVGVCCWLSIAKSLYIASFLQQTGSFYFSHILSMFL